VIVVDSSVWIGFFRGSKSYAVEKLRHIERAELILVGDVVLIEVLRGARDSRHALQLQTALSRFMSAPMLGAEMAVVAANHYRTLRGLGITVKLADLVIGTFAIEHGHDLLHEDRDYDHMARHLGLRVL
jgi:predicted nucleic acid-binding protein